MTKEEYLNNFRHITTNFIQKSSELEWLMIGIIAKHFCGDYPGKKLEFIALIHDYVRSSDSRRKMFNYVIIEHHKKLLKSRPNILGEIESFMKIRNAISHRILYSTYKEEDKFILRRPIKSDTMLPPYKGFDGVYDDFITTKKEHNSQIKMINEIIPLLQKLTDI